MSTNRLFLSTLIVKVDAERDKQQASLTHLGGWQRRLVVVAMRVRRDRRRGHRGDERRLTRDDLQRALFWAAGGMIALCDHVRARDCKHAARRAKAAHNRR